MISPDFVRVLRKMHEWNALEEHLRASVNALDSIADIEGDDRTVAIEVKARQRAQSALKAILEPFALFDEILDTAEAQETAADAGL